MYFFPDVEPSLLLRRAVRNDVVEEHHEVVEEHPEVVEEHPQP